MVRYISGLMLLIIGCNGGNTTQDFTVDQRVDGSEPDAFDATGTEMCVNDQGHVFIIWRDDRLNDKHAVWMNRSLSRGDEGTWLPQPIKVNHGEGEVHAASLGCSDDGVFIVWEDDRDGELENHQIYFNRSLDGGASWLDSDVLLEEDPDGLSMSLTPKIEVVGSDLYVAWYDDRDGASDIYMNSSANLGLEWRGPKRVDSDDPPGSAFSSRPKIGATNNEKVFAAWQDSRDGKSDIYFGRSDNGGATYVEDVRLDGGDDRGENDSFEPQLCTDGNRNITVVWHDSRNGEGRDIFINSSDSAGASWRSSATRVDSDAAGIANSFNPRCAMNGDTTHLVWHDNRNGGYDIYYRSIDNGLPEAEEMRVDFGTAPGTANSENAQIVASADTVVVAWQDRRADGEAEQATGYNDLYYNFRDNTGTWQVEGIRVDSMLDGQSFKVDLNLKMLGREIYFAWTDGRSGSADVYFQRYAIGEGGIAPTPEN